MARDLVVCWRVIWWCAGEGSGGEVVRGREQNRIPAGRRYHGRYFCEKPLGLYIVRGDSVLLIGELVRILCNIHTAVAGGSGDLRASSLELTCSRAGPPRGRRGKETVPGVRHCCVDVFVVCSGPKHWVRLHLLATVTLTLRVSQTPHAHAYADELVPGIRSCIEAAPGRRIDGGIFDAKTGGG